MCGIVGYIGKKPALPILLKGLKRLEYRGYDSAGVAIQNEKIERLRAVGKIDALVLKAKEKELEGSIGIAHTRWATHGGVKEENTHPHVDCSGNIAVVHNGIIENFRELKNSLKNHEFTSETDTEVLAHLIEAHYKGDLRAAVETALTHVQGTYGLLVISQKEPGKIIAARMGSPLVIGVGAEENYIASDTSPFLAFTQQVVFLDDGEVAEITDKDLQIFTLKDEAIKKQSEHIDWNETEAETNGFPNFMLKEIHDQPAVFQDALRGRLILSEGTSHLGGLNMTEKEMHSVKRIILIGCGTSSYAAMAGKNAFEKLAGIPTSVEIASEFRYSDPILDNETLVFALSQSGETADTLAAAKEAKRKGAFVRGIINVVGSTIARECDGGTYIHAGPELAVASTKAYTNMVAVLIMYALQFGRLKRVTTVDGQEFIKALYEIPDKMKSIFKLKDEIEKIAKKFIKYKDFYYLGRGVNFPVALEGSLKLKEITYVHSEAYPGGEMKHGPIALLAPDFPVVGILTQSLLYDKMRNNLEEAKVRGAPIIVVASEGDESVKAITENVIYVPKTLELLEPLLNTIPLQLFAYYVAEKMGRDVDRPRNLAKSVTVE